MPKVTEAHRQARRSEITDAALRCFAAKGFRGTSMADIIAASGLSAGAIYGHYASKEELFAAAARQVLSARTVELEDLRAEQGPLAMTMGLGSTQSAMNVATIQNVNGQAITLAMKHKDRRDPKSWKGDWKMTKRFNRLHDTDIAEVECTPDINENLPATHSKSLVN